MKFKALIILFCLMFISCKSQGISKELAKSNEISIVKNSVICGGNVEASYSFIKIKSDDKFKSIITYLFDDIKEKFDIDSGNISPSEILSKQIHLRKAECDQGK